MARKVTAMRLLLTALLPTLTYCSLVDLLKADLNDVRSLLDQVLDRKREMDAVDDRVRQVVDMVYGDQDVEDNDSGFDDSIFNLRQSNDVVRNCRDGSIASK